MTAEACVHFVDVPEIRPGDVFTACPMDSGLKVVCLALEVDPRSETINVARADSFVDEAAQADVVVTAEELGAPFSLVVQTGLTAQIWMCQAQEVIGRIDKSILHGIRQLRTGRFVPEIRDRLGIALLHPDVDERWELRTGALEELQALASDCADAHARLAEADPIRDPALELGASEGIACDRAGFNEAGMWHLLDEPDFACGEWDQITKVLQHRLQALLSEPVSPRPERHLRVRVHGGANLEALRCDSGNRRLAFAERVAAEVIAKARGPNHLPVLRVLTRVDVWQNEAAIARPLRARVGEHDCLIGFDLEPGVGSR